MRPNGREKLIITLYSDGRIRARYEISILELLIVQPSNGNKFYYCWSAVLLFQDNIQYPQHHECVACGKKFALVSELKKHSRIHTGDGPHECMVCHQKFTFSSDLKTHFLIHTAERPHECSVCGKSLYFVVVSKCTYRHMLVNDRLYILPCQTS